MKPLNTLTYIGVGANLGDARGNVRDAIARLGRMPGSAVLAFSSLYRTAPLDAGGDDYINAVVRIDTSLAALDLLQALHGIELAHGRERPYRNAPRTLDLDLLLYGPEHIDEPTLQVPHPRICERAFVLVPLLELAPDIAIPGRGPARRFLDAVAGQTIARVD
ncbi:MAG TPA: 2-amino-4-hydroxy-6-hydroxymethyldihydropteridine diphosphokinase [Janthinobacterium sp.]|nr:2-amino-4-hydroxy-6-hydroxymethyldihydropteridine diphosphokinase [Janthinobacterium sp.]